MRFPTASLVLVASSTLAFAACGGGTTPEEPSGPTTFAVTDAVLERGAGVYKVNCVACHGLEGRGDGPSAAALNPAPRDHSNREYMDELTDAEIASTIVAGGAPRGYPNMPSNPHIKGDDLVGLIAHVRTLGRGPGGVSEVVLDLE